jgi:hypothetical protein
MPEAEKKTNHTYTVELRFFGDSLDPDLISAELDLLPSNTLNQLQSQTSRTKRRPFWAYNGHTEAGFQAEWENLEDGFEFLLERLHSKKGKVHALASQFRGLWWCGHFQSSFNGGPTFSPKLLLEIGSYGIPLCIDNYFSD